MQECEEESRLLKHCFDYLQTRQAARRTFPKLRTIAVGSIYGFQEDIWHRWEAQKGPDSSSLEYCAEMFNTFCNHLDLEAFCVRDLSAPFGALPYLGWTWGTLPCTRTLHFDYDLQSLYLSFGGSVRWVSDFPSDIPYEGVTQLVSEHLHNVYKRQAEIKVRAGYKMKPTDITDLEIYCSTKTYAEELVEDPANPAPPGFAPPLGSFTPAEQAEQDKFTHDLADLVQQRFGRSSGLPDKIRWHPSPQTPICRACGSGPPP